MSEAIALFIASFVLGWAVTLMARKVYEHFVEEDQDE